jgi:glycerol-3-phosphate acyltransferase PlsY
MAYIIGSIPSAVWLSKYVYGKDVREHGSKNAGATNTFRVLGKTAGIIVLVVDIVKGIVAVVLARVLLEDMDSSNYRMYQLGLGYAATLGHVYSVFTGFKGGKGVATLTGVLYFIFPLAALVCSMLFLIIFITMHYISLSSMLSAVAFPITAVTIYHLNDLKIISMLALIPVLVIYTHRSNIKRIMHGEENKMFLFRKKS